MLIRELSTLPDLLAMQARAPKLFPLLLESAALGARARFDMLLATDGSGLRLSAEGEVRALDGTPVAGGFIDALDRAFVGVACPPPVDDPNEIPFKGGWALYLGYELAGEIEPSLRLPSGPAPLPCAQAWRSPVAVIIDRQQTRAFVVAESGFDSLWDEVCALATTAPSRVSLTQACARVIEADDAQFIDGVTRVIDYLAAGDVFQVNLSRGWTAHFPTAPNPTALYRRLRQSSPAPFAGLLMADDWTVLSSSPERLVSRRGARIETRPIAGTRARTQGDDDAARIRELVEHPKERAEHIMLIDLERNDLGRVCETGSVRVDALMEVESYADVHHIESTVSGRARADLTPGQLIRAVFPGGTITGCPKVRCMQIIAELEGVGRGPYTGAFGWLGVNGDLDLNILIRSAWLCGDQLGMRTGAGIVIDSDAKFELAETRAKARGLLRALAASA
ncbi:MAG: aminodeoxychorismate synthase component I [Pseudomarimonas sp.]